MPVIGCLEIFQNGRSPQPITGIIYSPGPHELKIGSAVEDTLGFIPLVYRGRQKGKQQKIIELAVSHLMTVATNLEALKDREQN